MTRMTARRSLLAGLIASCCVHAADTSAQPAKFPGAGRVSLVVPFSPGGTTDIVARLIAQELSVRWSSAVIVENKPGAGGNIAAEYIARSTPDGYSLLVAATSFANAPALAREMRYDIRKDFAPVTMLATSPLVLMVSNKSGIRSVPELVARLKAEPNALNYGSSGVGTSINFSTLMFLHHIDAKATHVVYKGSGPALLALASGEIDMLFDNYATAMPFATNGQARGLALTGLTRANLKTDLPTLDELGFKNFESLTWIGLLAPAGTPSAIIARLNAEVSAILQTPTVQEKLLSMGFSPQTSSPEKLGAFIQARLSDARTLVKANSISLD